MSPLSFTGKQSNPKQETSYSTQAGRHARSQSNAVTYGGKCVAQRSYLTTQGILVNWFLSVIFDASSLTPLISDLQSSGRGEAETDGCTV